MAYRIELASRAQRDFRKLPVHIQPQIARQIAALSRDPRPHGVEMLTAPDRLYRVRSGDCRVICQIRGVVLLVPVPH